MLSNHCGSGQLAPLVETLVALEVGFGWDSFLETQWRWRFLWYYCSFMSFSHFRGIISDPGLMSEWAGNAEILAHFTQCDFIESSLSLDRLEKRINSDPVCGCLDAGRGGSLNPPNKCCACSNNGFHFRILCMKSRCFWHCPLFLNRVLFGKGLCKDGWGNY